MKNMVKRHFSLPTKLFFSFGVLLFCSLMLILTFLYFIYNNRVNEEIYLRIHNGGKAAINTVYNNIADLKLALKEFTLLANLSKADIETDKPTGQTEMFCQDWAIDYLCYIPFETDAYSAQNLCGGNEEQNLCAVDPLITRQNFVPAQGVSVHGETLALEAHLEARDLDGYWKTGIAVDKDYMDYIHNLIGMNIIILSQKDQVPVMSTLSEEHEPFSNFKNMPKKARHALNQFSVYTFRWQTGNVPYQFILYPLLSLNDELIGAWGVGFSLKANSNANRNAFYVSMLFTLSIVLTFLALAILTARYFLQPLVELKKTIRSFLAKQKNMKVAEAADEVSFLDESFKQITEELHTSLILLEKAEIAEKIAHRETLLRLAIAAEYKDAETAAHILRLSKYSELIAKKMGLPENEVEIIRDASPMHDIGKIGVPDYILQKKGPLTAKEFEIMKTHPAIGASIFKRAKTPLYEACRAIALTHHERWDGSGYPQGLKGEEIPLYARIVAVADVFDALTSVRHYKPAYSLDKSLQLMKEGIGTHFDPKVVDAFIKCLPEIKKILAIGEHDLKIAGVDINQI